GRVRVNGTVVRRGDAPVRTADRVELGPPPDAPIPAPLRLVHEDAEIFVVHRLDRETSGLLVFARTLKAKDVLQEQFRARTPERVYVARVEGNIRDDTGTLTSRLVEDRSLRVRPSRDTRQGREAITRYR